MYGPRVPELFESPKLIVSKTSGKGYKLRAAFDDQGFYTDQRCILITDYRNIDDTQLQSKFKGYHRISLNVPLTSLLGLINSKLMSFYFANRLSTGNLQGEYSDVVPKMVRKLPVQANFGDLSSGTVSSFVDSIINMLKEKRKLNLHLQDYIGKYEEGQTLKEVYVPKKGISDSILQKTTTGKNGLKIGSLVVQDEGEVVVLKVSARYKPKEGRVSSQNLDQWGYAETNLIPAMQFPVDNKMKSLIKEFVPLAARKAEGFANFRKNATKTISPIERLEKLTLPKLEDVESGLEKYLEQKEKAEKLEEEIQETDHQIDAIVFDLYDLNEREVKTVLDSLETPEGEKIDILQRFRQVE